MLESRCRAPNSSAHWSTPFSSASVPVSDGSGAKSKQIDFVARQVVLDSIGGPASIPKSVGVAGKINVPAITLVMRADGSVAVR